MADVFNIAGRIHSTSQEEVVTTTNEILDATQEKKQSEVNQEVSEELALHTNRLNALTGQNYVTVVATQSTTAADIPTLINASGEGEQADTLYRVGFWDGSVYVADKYTEYAWNGTAYVILDVKSSIGEVFDISLYKAVGGVLATFADLSAALDGGNNVPAGVRQGGMSIKFVQSSDNKYVQYRLMSQTFSTTESDWQGVDDEPVAGDDILNTKGSINLLKSGNLSYNGELVNRYYVLSLASVGEQLTISTANATGYTGIILDVEKGDVFIINTNTTTIDAKAYAILDDDNYVLAVEQNANNKILVMPEGAAKLIVNTKIVPNQDFLIKVLGVLDKKLEDADFTNTPQDMTDKLRLEGILKLFGNNVYNYVKGSTRYYYKLNTAVVGQVYAPAIGTAAYAGIRIGVSRGDVFLVNSLLTNSNVYAYAILDSNNIVLDVQPSAHNKIIIMPDNAAILIFNTGFENNATAYLYKLFDNFNVADIKLWNKLLYLAGNGEEAILEYSLRDGYYYNKSGDTYSYEQSVYWAVSEPIYVAKGTKINMHVTSSFNKGLIMACNSDGEVTSVLLESLSSSNVDFEYTIQESGYIRVTLAKDTGCYTTIHMYGVANANFTDIRSDSIYLSETNNKYIYLGSVANVGDVLPSMVPANAAGYGYYIGKVYAGETYKIKTKDNTSGAKSYVILNSNNEVTAISANSGEHIVTVSEDGILVVNSKVSDYGITILNWDYRLKKTLYDKIYKDIVKAAIYDIARFNNDFRFDYLEADSLYAGGIRLGFETSLPREGSIINTDVELRYGLNGSTNMEDVRKRIVPYLYWNQVKVGTILLYDTDGSPYFYDKNGNKKTLVVNE